MQFECVEKDYLIYIEKNDFTKALDSFQRAFALEPSSQAAISGIFEAEQGIKTNKITELEKKQVFTEFSPIHFPFDFLSKTILGIFSDKNSKFLPIFY